MADKPKKPRVAILLPCQDTIKSRTAFSMVHAAAYAIAEGTEIDMILRLGCDIVGSRTWLVQQAQKHHATHILFIDHDMFFPPEAIQRLVRRDKDIIGGAYNFRLKQDKDGVLPPPKSTAFPLDGIEPKGVYKCNGVGTGFLMVKMEVFDNLPKNEQWFQFGRNAEGELVYGEDIWFCQQAIKAGYEVWADDTLNIKHLGEYEF